MNAMILRRLLEGVSATGSVLGGGAIIAQATQSGLTPTNQSLLVGGFILATILSIFLAHYREDGTD